MWIFDILQLYFHARLSGLRQNLQPPFKALLALASIFRELWRWKLLTSFNYFPGQHNQADDTDHSSFLSDVSWVELLLQRGTPNESVTGWGIFGTLVRTWRTPGNKCKYIIFIVHSLIKTFIWLFCCQQVLQEMITKVLPIFRKCRNLGRNVQI